MRRISVPLLWSVLGMLTATTALAGRHEQADLVVAPGVVIGDLGVTHNSPDSVTNVGCWTNGVVGGCSATNSAGVKQDCFTNDSELVAVINSLRGDSQVLFAWDANNTCTIIAVTTESTLAPK